MTEPPPETLTFAVSCTELSGDTHLSHLIEAMREAAGGERELEFFGLASEESAEQGAELVRDVAGYGAIGIFDNLLKAPRYLLAYRALLSEIERREPDAVILVDGRFFNLRLARALRNRGYEGKIIYYIAPIRWESLYRDEPGGLERFEDVKEFCDFAIPAYPVSLDRYRELDIPHAYLGHPLNSRLNRVEERREDFLGRLDTSASNRLLLLLPGSRDREVQMVAPEMFRAAAGALREVDGVTPVCTLARESLQERVRRIAKREGLNGLRLLKRGDFLTAMVHADATATASGTALHAALLTLTPALMAYRVPGWQAWLARHLLGFNMPHYGFINLMAGQEVVREFIQEDCTAERIQPELRRLLDDREYRSGMLAEMERVRGDLVRDDPAGRAAELVLKQTAGGSGYKVKAEPDQGTRARK